MAEGDATVFNDFKHYLSEGVFNTTTDTVKLGMVAGYSPNVDTDSTWGDISSNETGVANYAAGGETIGSITSVMNTTSDAGVVDGANVTWSSLGAGSPSHVVAYDDTPTTPANPLMIAWELGTNSNGGDYTIQFAGTGIYTIS